MIILKLETYEIRTQILKVSNYKVNNAVVIEFADRNNAIECASYFNKMRHIYAECDDNNSVLIYAKDRDSIKISSAFIDKKHDSITLKINKFEL